MAPRPNWKGYLKLSLVSCPVALFPATTTSERVSFRTLNRATGNRVRRQFVDEQTSEPVETEDQIKGYEVAKGEFIQIEDDELKSVQIESNHTIDIEQFVPRSDVDQLYLDTPYYLTPTDRVGEEAFAVIRDAMRAEKVVGLARVVLFRRERILMLEPRAKGIVATSLHFANEVHAASGLFRRDPRPRAAQADAGARHPHHREDDGHFEPEQFEDRYENALIELIRSKQKGMPIKPQPTHRQTNVINLMDALRRSVEGAGAEAAKASAPSASRPRSRRPRKPRPRRRRRKRARRRAPRARRARPGDAGRIHGQQLASRVPRQARLHAHQGAARSAQAQQRATCSSCTSTPRAACTTTCAWSSTACSRAGPSPGARASPGRQAPRGAHRGPSARLRRVRGPHPRGRVRRRQRDRLGPRALVDRGRPAPAAGQGPLVVDLDGSKLKGRWHLVHMKGRDRARQGELAADQGRGRARDGGRRRPSCWRRSRARSRPGARSRTLARAR